MTRIWQRAIVVAGAVLALALPAPSFASCIGPLTAKQYEKRANVIFVGVALEGPTPTGVQRFRVDRYLKGTGPETVAVATGVVARSDGTGSTTSVSVNVSAGERWQIYATKSAKTDVLETSLCAGSGKLAFTGHAGDLPNPPAPIAATGGDRTKFLFLATCLGALALLSLAFVVRRRLRRTESSPG